MNVGHLLLLHLILLLLLPGRWRLSSGSPFDRTMSHEQGLALLINRVGVDAPLDPAAFALCSDIQWARSQVGASIALGLDEEFFEESIAADARELAIAAL